MKKLSQRPESILHLIIRESEVPPQGKEVTLKADAEEREKLTSLAKLASIEKLEATLNLLPYSKHGLRVRGEISAVVTYTCVLSLEAFSSPIREEIDVTYMPPGRQAAKEVTVDMEEEDAPEILVDGQADIGKLVQEFFILALDPYPRKPGARFADINEPPAKLLKLKR